MDMIGERAKMAKNMVHSKLTESKSFAVDKDKSGWQPFSDINKVTKLYQKFPATFALLTPYVFLIIPPAFFFGNPDVWFLIGVATLALIGTLTADVFSLARKNKIVSRTTAIEYGPGLFWLAFIIISLSSLIGVASAYSGVGSVAVQIGIANTSSGYLGLIDSLIRGWDIIGLGILCAVYIGRQCSRKSFFLVVLIPIISNMLSAILTQRTAPLFDLVTFLAVLFLLLGIVKLKFVLMAIIVTLIVWPAVFDARNELRIEEGVRVSESVEAFDRIRFDLQFARAQELESPLNIEVPTHLVHPSAIDILRFGLIPRIFDPNREVISTGQVINFALGGTLTSAFTFGPVTTAYVLEGPIYVAIYYFLLAVIVNLIWKSGSQITPIRIILLALVLYGPLGWFSTFPDAIMGTLQSTVSSIPILFVLLVLHHKNRTRSMNRPRGKKKY